MRLYRAFATVGGFTMASRVLGFVRDVLIAAVIGTGAVADAFFVAFRLPNLFRRLFAEGAFNSAFVPLFAKRLEGEGQDAARQFAEEAMAVLLTALIIISALAIVFMPALILVMAPGFTENPEKFDLAVLLSRITFPYLLCLSLVALLSGILNSFHKFAAAAAAPVLLNVILSGVMVVAAWLGYKATPEAGVILAWGVFAAGIAQLLVLIWAVRRQNFSLSLRWPRLTPGVKRLVKLGIPGLIAGGITQVNILVGTIIASMQASAVSWLYYADRLYQLPLGVVGVAIGVVLLPDLARRLRAGDHAAVHHSQNRSLEFALMLTLPAAIALIVVAEPILRVLFERGAFTPADTAATAQALAAFAMGLPAFVLIKVFSPGYFAREDTRTPMIYAGISMVVNVVASVALFPFLGHVGIAIATSLAGWINAALLWFTLARRREFTADARLIRNLPRILLASAAMGAAVWWLGRVLAPYFAPEAGLAIQFATLAGLVSMGGLVFAAFIQLTGVAHWPTLLQRLRRGRAG